MNLILTIHHFIALVCSPLDAVTTSFAHGHWALLIAAIVMGWSALFSPLAGSLFNSRLTNITTTNVTVQSAGVLGINNVSLGTEATFAAAAGVSNYFRTRK